MEGVDDENVSAFRTINKSEISASVDGASYSHFEEEKLANNVSKTRVGEFDRSSIGGMESGFDHPSMEDDHYADMKAMKLQQYSHLPKSRNNEQPSESFKDITGMGQTGFDTHETG